MKLTPELIEPGRLLRPGTVAARLQVNQSMVTHWTQDGVMDFIEIDGAKFIPEEVVNLHLSMRKLKQSRKDSGLKKAVV